MSDMFNVQEVEFVMCPYDLYVFIKPALLKYGGAKDKNSGHLSRIGDC